MFNEKNLQEDEFKDFIKNIANIAAASKIIPDGIQYVDNSMFWQWVTTVYKNGNYLPNLGTADAVKNFLEASPDQLKGIKTIIQGKGYEWDVFRQHHPNLVDINTLPGFNSEIKSNVSGHDITSQNPITGNNVIIEAKSAMSYDGIEKSARKFFTYPQDRVFDVTKSVHDRAVELGMPENRFINVRPDNEISQRANERYNDALAGNIDVGITLEGFLKQVGQGALIGATLYVGVSALTNYRNYKKGLLSFDEFAEVLIKDGAKGGVIGGSMAAINVGVQYAATVFGVGAPVTIPVMIVISVGLKKFIDPFFGDGEYLEILNSMKYSTSFQNAWLDFGLLSVSLFEKQKQLKSFEEGKVERAKLLNNFSQALDNKLNDELAKE